MTLVTKFVGFFTWLSPQEVSRSKSSLFLRDLVIALSYSLPSLVYYIVHCSSIHQWSHWHRDIVPLRPSRLRCTYVSHCPLYIYRCVFGSTQFIWSRCIRLCSSALCITLTDRLTDTFLYNKVSLNEWHQSTLLLCDIFWHWCIVNMESILHIYVI